MSDQSKVYITIAELSKRWGVPASTLGQWRSRGQGAPFVRFEANIRYRLADVLEYENRQRVDPAKRGAA